MWHYDTLMGKWREACLKYTALGVLTVSIREFLRDKVSSTASALTYSTLLSCVPIIAVLVAVSRGFGVNETLEASLREALGSQQEVADYLMGFVNSYLTQAHSGLFLGVGLIALLITIINLISNIESAFNDIWDIKAGRSLYRRITDYFSFFLLLPIFIVASSGLTVFINSIVSGLDGFALLGGMTKFLVHLSPFFMSWLMFTVLYIFMPNKKVQFVPALISGIVAGTAYQLFQMLYINSQIGLSRYSAVYGSFAALPLLLFWLQISWTIILYGVELCYTIQNKQYNSYLEDTEKMSRQSKDHATLLLMSMIAQHFQSRQAPLSALKLSEQTHLPIRFVQKLLDRCLSFSLIHTTINKDGDVCYQPSMDIHELTVGAVLDAIYHYGSGETPTDPRQFDRELLVTRINITS